MAPLVPMTVTDRQDAMPPHTAPAVPHGTLFMLGGAAGGSGWSETAVDLFRTACGCSGMSTSWRPPLDPLTPDMLRESHTIEWDSFSGQA